MATTLIPISLPTFNTPPNCSVSLQTWKTLLLFFIACKNKHILGLEQLLQGFCSSLTARCFSTEKNLISSSLLVPRFYHPLSFPSALSKAKLVLAMSVTRCSHLRGKQHSGCCKIFWEQLWEYQLTAWSHTSSPALFLTTEHFSPFKSCLNMPDKKWRKNPFCIFDVIFK